MKGLKAYRKKPVVISAVQFDGSVRHVEEIGEWMGQDVRFGARFFPATNDNVVMFIPTLEGTMEANPGDFIIKGVAGEFYPCKPDIFEATYEEV